jgi:hypothetical protein
VLRNFGGIPAKSRAVMQTFFTRLNLPLNRAVHGVEDSRNGVVELVRQNCSDLEARHLMLLTKNNAALPMLFDEGILAHDSTEVRDPCQPTHRHGTLTD